MGVIQADPSRDVVFGANALTEHICLLAVEHAAREYARHSHGNMVGDHYRAREEARDKLLDALSELDVARSK